MNENERDTEHRAARDVCGLYMVAVRHSATEPWTVNFCERTISQLPPFGLALWSQTIRGEHFRGRTFETPEAAAAYVRQLIAA